MNLRARITSFFKQGASEDPSPGGRGMPSRRPTPPDPSARPGSGQPPARSAPRGSQLAEHARADDLGDQVLQLLGENRDLRSQIQAKDIDLAMAREAAGRTEEDITRLAAFRANEIACRMGAPPIRSEDHTLESNGGKTLLDRYVELNEKDPRAAAKFAAAHGGAIGLIGGLQSQ